ncbi:hypothetical protein H5410_019316 [Solanum commersonii]|uniref:Uncharacterized protein n=1 Tax=Solanum commersonii TaxID=4109 RepID=A0A9J5Z4W0_SOLCO|nr:hypothetical protein H5410_019316 [Solanum commersonii]
MPFSLKITRSSVKTLAMEPFSNHGKPHILPIFVCYYPRDILVTRNSNVIFAKKLHCPPLRPSYGAQLVTMAKTAHFKGQTILGAGKPLFYRFSCAIIYEIFCWSPRLKLPIFKVKRVSEQVNPSFFQFSYAIFQGLSYRASWSPRLKRPISKVKQTLEQPIFVRYSARDLLVTRNFNIFLPKIYMDLR